MAVAHAFVWRPDISFDEVKILHTEEPVLQQELFQQAIFQLQIEMDRAALNMRESDSRQTRLSAISQVTENFWMMRILCRKSTSRFALKVCMLHLP